jgi:hypothetical protein
MAADTKESIPVVLSWEDAKIAQHSAAFLDSDLLNASFAKHIENQHFQCKLSHIVVDASRATHGKVTATAVVERAVGVDDIHLLNIALMVWMSHRVIDYLHQATSFANACTVEYTFAKDTPGTWRFDAIKEGKLECGSDAVYVQKTVNGKSIRKPEKVMAVFTMFPLKKQSHDMND